MLAPAADILQAGRGDLVRARLLALLTPLALLAGAWGFQLIGGLPPCEMCHWQRWGHYAALGAAALSFAVPRSRLPLVLAALAILASGAVGAFHAGVEQGWWEGITGCTAPAGGSFADILSAPIIRCDAIPWSLAGVSMAGWNAILSLSAGIAILWLTLKR